MKETVLLSSLTCCNIQDIEATGRSNSREENPAVLNLNEIKSASWMQGRIGAALGNILPRKIQSNLAALMKVERWFELSGQPEGRKRSL